LKIIYHYSEEYKKNNEYLEEVKKKIYQNLYWEAESNFSASCRGITLRQQCKEFVLCHGQYKDIVNEIFKLKSLTIADSIEIIED